MNAEETAINMLNKGLKKVDYFNITTYDLNQKKEVAKDISLNEITAIKEALYNITLIDEIAVNQIKNTLSFYNKVQKILEAF